MNNIPSYNITELRLSHSSRNSLHACERILEFTKFLNFPRTEAEQSLAAKTGTALHYAYQTWLKTQDTDEATLSLMLHYPIHLNSDTTNGRSIEACYASLIELTNHPQLYQYQIATIRNPAGQVVEAIEVPFEITIVGHPFPFPVVYCGFIDAILFNTVDHSYLPVDLKTTRVSMQSYDAVFANSTQCLPYGLALHTLQSHATIHDFNIIYVSVYTDILDPKIQKYEYTKTTADIQDWIDSLTWDLHTIYNRYQRQWFDKNGESCVRYGNRCTFFDICKSRNVSHMKVQQQLQIDAIIATNGEYKPHVFPEPWINTTLQLTWREAA